MTIYLLKNETGVITGMASLFSSLIAGVACAGPLLGIMLGIGGLGWISQYSYLTVPASVASMLLLAVALNVHRRRKCCVANRRRHRMQQALLVITTFVVIAVNAFEYLILPNMA